ncbi:rhomboid family intramembrane serine protease [Actinomyces faecalis]|uniref:rhomboid family intramembrane serine protease n=1 Tax=Actinomyces faecalis TaxID=2722820 RepID=UPI0015539F54|nr:rhomboid family intramembrane serine protease [Actinomyces faecalis]
MSQDSPAAASDAQPVCPRHPDRVSYVRCQRCGRPACPECQVPSAVGVHCVDCVRQAQQRRQPTRTLLGGVAVQDARITTGLIVACVAVYVVQMLLPSLTADLGFAPVVALDQPWRFLTTAFLHGSLMHLAFNMWALWVCGTSLEPLLGRWRFAVLYALSALGGSTAIYLLASPVSRSWITLTVGASGAVFGLFAAVFIIQRRFGRDTSAILGLLAVNLVISVLGAGISWQGHLGGLLTGLVVASLFAWAPRERRGPVAVWGSVGIGLVLAALVAAKYLLV